MTPQSPSPAEMYEQFYGPGMFQPLTAVFVEYVAPQLGEHVLDMACGTGMVARHVAPLVGSDGTVVGIDINPAMLAVARNQPVPPGASIEWREGDAATVDLPDQAFDLALCQQGLQFFPDQVAVLQRLRRSLVAGGRIGIAVWQGIEQQSLVAEFAEIELHHLAPLGVSYADLVAPFSLGDAEQLRLLIESAGFTRIVIEPRSIEAHFSAPETFARNMETAYGAVIPAFIENPAAFAVFLDTIEHETRDLVQRHVQGGMVHFMMSANLAIAYRE
ncbi:MAG TPA: class I SAM-dependent methyltransferase [Roseiflexaceae bacterium]|nr:class I SAM-dependent methyltransferase [Roseiflexaceae bacterium]HMP42525.1 class I SAM-dependent methyltransferase [Roseiflexaceae bacterium]